MAPLIKENDGGGLLIWNGAMGKLGRVESLFVVIVGFRSTSGKTVTILFFNVCDLKGI